MFAIVSCHSLLMKPTDLNDIAILNIKDVNDCCIISGISECETLNLLKNVNMTDKKMGHYKL